MKKISKILETKEVVEYLKKRKLDKQYKKAKRYLLNQRLVTVRFRERRPKGSGIWYFRINKQFRALGVFNEEGDLVVFKIDDHQ